MNDLHVPGALGQYGLDFTRYWNSTHNDYDNPDAEWSTDFGQSGWSHSWKWNATYTGEVIEPEGWGETIYNMTITITYPDGHTTKYKITRSNWDHGGGANPRLGPDYTPVEIDTGWPAAGIGVHDHLTKMAVNGSEFWLTRADGGSVHFVWISPQGANHGFYRATEVFDPHGLKTTLTHNPTTGLLERVEQEGGRYLRIIWSYFNQGGAFITRVETGGAGGGGAQYVTYKYNRQGGPFYLLTKVSYPNDPAPGQTAEALYTYGSCYGDETEPCATNAVPMLKRADDPRYAGAMTKIRYNYNGVGCAPILLHPEAYPEWVGAQPYAIAAEKSDAWDLVSSFDLGCDNGLREEYNGLGGHRKFYFGSSANTVESGFYCRGFQLGKVTDFYQGTSENVPNQRQNFLLGEPRKMWDGRNIPTEQFQTPGDDSGAPGEVRFIDGSNSTYDRVNPGDSSNPDGPGMHNPYNHWLFSKKDERGNVTTYTRDSRRRVTQVSYYNGPAQSTPVAIESFTYNEFNQVETHTLPSGAVQHYEYDGLHRLEREYNSWDIAVSSSDFKFYQYYGPGNHPEWTDLVELVVDGRARVAGAPFTVRMTYNGRQQVLTEEHASMTGQYPTVRYEYDKYGNRTAVIDELGHRKDFTYDAYRRCTSSTEQVGSGANCNNVQLRRWDWIYDRVIEGDWMPTRPAYAHTSKEWRIQIEPEFNDAHHRRATSRTFDANNRLLSEQTGLIQLPNDLLGTLQTVSDTETHRVTYDENGQKHTSTDPLGRVTTYGYNNRNRLETTTEPKRQDQQDYPVTRFEYDVAGNKKKVTFPDTKTQRWESYDAFGQAWEFFDERNNRTDLTYQWGPMKKLDTVSTYRQKDNNAGTETQVTDFEYDGMGRPTWTIFPDGSSELTGYELGQLSAFKTRKNQTKRLHYDARGREDYQTWDAGVAPRIDRIWDDANRLTRIWNNFSIIDYTYDEAGQVRTEGTTVTGDGVARQVRYCRYPNGEVSQITYPNGSTVVNRFYTPRGQLQGVGWGANMSTSYAYLDDGKVNYQARSNGVTTSYGYDGRGMIGSLRHTKDGYDLAKRDYWRDDRDRIVAWKRGIGGPNGMEDGRGDRYGYDPEGQLERAWYRAQNPETENPDDPKRGDEFQYDALGNRAGTNRVASRGVMNFERKNNKLNQYRGWWPYSITNYDEDLGGWGEPGEANGVLMQDGWITAGFNALNQPVCMWSPAYPGGESAHWLRFGYDPLGRSVKRWKALGNGTPVTAATYYYYDGWNLIQEGSSTTTERVYVHGNRVDEIVASWGNGQWYNHHYDARGHCIMLTSASGSIQEQYDYDAFGLPYVYQANGTLVPLKLGSPAGNRFLFTGREWLKDLKVYDYRNRIYQPELGRFLQPDPSGFSAGDYNLYRYCHNDPVNKSDPTGMAERIQEDFQWKMNSFFDGGNSIQGDYNAFMNPSHDHTPMGTNKVADGNYNDPNIEHHRREQDEGGVTQFTMGNVKSGVTRPTLNWWVQKEHMDDKTILGELEHVSRHLWSAENGDVAAAIRKFNADPNGPLAKDKLENARLVESNLQRKDLHGNPNRHDLNTNRKLWEKMTPGEIQNAIRNIMPMEDPRPKYLGY